MYLYANYLVLYDYIFNVPMTITTIIPTTQQQQQLIILLLILLLLLLLLLFLLANDNALYLSNTTITII